MKIPNKWSLENIPPEGHSEVGDFAEKLFLEAKGEKDRLRKNESFAENYALYRGRLSKGLPVNLFFTNVERTVANVTARDPVGEVVGDGGEDDLAAKSATQSMVKWWKETKQSQKLKRSARAMEINGITVEKPFWDTRVSEPDIVVTDPHAFFPAPGVWGDLSTEAPYVAYVYAERPEAIEKKFGVPEGTIKPAPSMRLLGLDRDRPGRKGTQKAEGNYADGMIKMASEKTDIERSLVVEVWVRDSRKQKRYEEEPLIDAEGEMVIDELTGEPVIQKREITFPVYPDGVRKITFTYQASKTDKEPVLVLDDSSNPNINAALPVEQVRNTWPWGRFPCYHANSYTDPVSTWGFSVAEQTGDLIEHINQILRKLLAYTHNVLTPPLIVQKHCGITKSMIETNLKKAGRLVLMPTVPNARIEFLQVPNLPNTFFDVLNIVTGFFDRVYTIEDADRGVVPAGVTAASAIVALQERNQLLMQNKMSAIDQLVMSRTQWALGLEQNFGTREKTVVVENEPVTFRGVDLVGSSFSYVVEQGSSMPRTSLQTQELAMKLYEGGAISIPSLLKAVNFPEKEPQVTEGAIKEALTLLLKAGVPEDVVINIGESLMSENPDLQEQG